MKIGLDFHGVIDKKPSYFSTFTKYLLKRACLDWHRDHPERSHEIHIITGHEDTQEFRKRLSPMGIQWTHLFSVISYHKNIGTHVEYDEKGDPWVDEGLWNKAKADYCQKQKIDILIDDSNTYGKYFTDIHTAYIHIDTFNLLREVIG